MITIIIIYLFFVKLIYYLNYKVFIKKHSNISIYIYLYKITILNKFNTQYNYIKVNAFYLILIQYVYVFIHSLTNFYLQTNNLNYVNDYSH